MDFLFGKHIVQGFLVVFCQVAAAEDLHGKNAFSCIAACSDGFQHLITGTGPMAETDAHGSIV